MSYPARSPQTTSFDGAFEKRWGLQNLQHSRMKPVEGGLSEYMRELAAARGSVSISASVVDRSSGKLSIELQASPDRGLPGLKIAPPTPTGSESGNSDSEPARIESQSRRSSENGEGNSLSTSQDSPASSEKSETSVKWTGNWNSVDNRAVRRSPAFASPEQAHAELPKEIAHTLQRIEDFIRLFSCDDIRAACDQLDALEAKLCTLEAIHCAHRIETSRQYNDAWDLIHACRGELQGWNDIESLMLEEDAASVANACYLKSQFHLKNGLLFVQDSTQSLAYLRIAAELGHKVALGLLELHDATSESFAVTNLRAANYFWDAAAEGDIEGLHQLGILCLRNRIKDFSGNDYPYQKLVNNGLEKITKAIRAGSFAAQDTLDNFFWQYTYEDLGINSSIESFLKTWIKEIVPRVRARIQRGDASAQVLWAQLCSSKHPDLAQFSDAQLRAQDTHYSLLSGRKGNIRGQFYLGVHVDIADHLRGESDYFRFLCSRKSCRTSAAYGNKYAANILSRYSIFSAASSPFPVAAPVYSEISLNKSRGTANLSQHYRLEANRRVLEMSIESADFGSRESYRRIGLMLLENPTLFGHSRREIAKLAKYCLEKCVQLGLTAAGAHIAEMYSTGILDFEFRTNVLQQRDLAAIKVLIPSVAAGSTNARYRLGILYLKATLLGQHRTLDLQHLEAAELLRRAAMDGSTQAMTIYCDFYVHEKEGFNEDRSPSRDLECLKWLKIVALDFAFPRAIITWQVAETKPWAWNILNNPTLRNTIESAKWEEYHD